MRSPYRESGINQDSAAYVRPTDASIDRAFRRCRHDDVRNAMATELHSTQLDASASTNARVARARALSGSSTTTRRHSSTALESDSTFKLSQAANTSWSTPLGVCAGS